MKRTITTNIDSHDLGPWIGPDGGATGFVDEIAGEGAIEFPAFVPTRQELLLLAKHYATEILDGSLFFYVTSSSGSTDWRMRHYADRRLHRIVKLLGESAIAQVWQEVEAHFEKKMSAAAWEKFCKWRKGE